MPDEHSLEGEEEELTMSRDRTTGLWSLPQRLSKPSPKIISSLACFFFFLVELAFLGWPWELQNQDLVSQSVLERSDLEKCVN